MESVTADDQTVTVPASPPRRDPVEDADSSLTRKRPRLDNGTVDNRTMPATATSNLDTNTTPPSEQQVEMTIRSQPPSSSQPTDSPAESNGASAPMAALEDTIASVGNSSGDQLGSEEDAPADSPPVIAIDDDNDEDDGEDVMGDYTAGYIHIDHDHESYFQRFPFSANWDGDYMGALHQMITHFSGSMLTLVLTSCVN